MPNDQGKGVCDFFLAYFDRYEKYHGAKETLVWLAATVYMGFAGATMNWLVTTSADWSPYRVWLAVGIGLVCLLLSTFLWLQNEYKASSVNVSNKLDAWLSTFDLKKQPTFAQLESLVKCANEMKVKRWSPGGGLAGSVLWLLVVALGVAQILVVALYQP